MKCRNRECKKTVNRRGHYCCDVCKYRENYLRGLDRKGKAPMKKPYLEKTKIQLITKVEVSKKNEHEIKHFSTKWLEKLWNERKVVTI